MLHMKRASPQIGILLLMALFLFASDVWAEGPDTVSHAYNSKDSNITDNQPDTLGNADSVLPSQDEPPSFAATLVKMILSLLLIVFLIYVLLRILSRAKTSRLSGPFRLVGGIHLAPHRSIQIVEIGKHMYIVGVGDEVRLLQRLEDEEEMDTIRSLVEGSAAQTNEWKALRNWFQKITKRGKLEEQSFESMLSEKLNSYRARHYESNRDSNASSNEEGRL